MSRPRPRRPSARVALALAAVGLAHAGCGDITSIEATRTTAQQLRPTEGEGQFGNGYGDVEVRSYPSPGGLFRVWWATDGRHAPRSTDADNSGVPDYVELVGTVADEVGGRVVDEGWSFPLADTSLSGGGDNGGDGRFDIYLVDTGGGDGYLVAELCTGTPPRCSAHAVIENDFFGYGYPSLEYAVGVLVSHEFFHGVQNAYNAEIPAWWSEGTATWFEEHFDPSQQDFERLASHFFDEPTRSLNAIGRGPADGFVYGTAVFPWFIAESYGYEAVRGVFERYSTGQALEEAIADELGARGETMDEAFARFAMWTAFTGTRAVDGFGYPNARDLPAFVVDAVSVTGSVNLDEQVNALAAEHTRLELDGAYTFEARALDGWERAPTFAVAVINELGDSGAIALLEPGVPVRFEAGAVHVVAVNSAAQGDAAGRMAIRAATDEAPVPDDGSGEGSGGVPVDGDGAADGGSATGCSAAPTRHGASGLLLAMGALLRRRRRSLS